MTAKLPTKGEVRLLVAEDVRPELAGKLSLMGLVPGERFLVGGDPPPGAPPGVAFVLPSLAFIFVIVGGEGEFNGRFKIIGPDKKTVIADTPTVKPIEIGSGRGAVFVTASKPFIGPQFGTYTVQLFLAKAKFSFPLTIERAPTQQRAKRA